MPIIRFFARPLKATNAVTPKSTTPPTPGISPSTDITKSTPVLTKVLPEVNANKLTGDVLNPIDDAVQIFHDLHAKAEGVYRNIDDRLEKLNETYKEEQNDPSDPRLIQPNPVPEVDTRFSQPEPPPSTNNTYVDNRLTQEPQGEVASPVAPREVASPVAPREVASPVASPVAPKPPPVPPPLPPRPNTGTQKKVPKASTNKRKKKTQKKKKRRRRR